MGINFREDEKPIFKDFKIELEKHLSIQTMKRRGIK